MTKGKYLTVTALFALGVGLITFGVTSNAEATLWGITFHARLAKAFGLISTLGSIITFLVIYGNSLPPSQSERRLEMTHALRRGEQPRRRKQTRSDRGFSINEPKRDEPHSAVRMRRVTTESWLHVMAERRNSSTPTTETEERSKSKPCDNYCIAL
jgi:hypothetical protein